MKRVKSYDELSNLISKHLKKGVFTNCFLSKEDFESSISNRKLFYQIFDGGLLIFQKMSGYFNLKFYINNFNNKLKINIKKKIVIEIATKNEKDVEMLKEFFFQAGFSQVLKRERFTCEKDVKIENEILRTIDKTNLKDYRKIVKILRKNFDKYIGCIPSKESLKQDIIDDRIYCCKIDKKIVGILHISYKLKTTEIKHLAVDKEYRDKSIAKALLTKYFEDTNGLLKHVWTSSDNEIAKHVYGNFGYKPDGYTSIVLMRQ